MRFIPLASTFLLVAATAQAGSNVKTLGKQFRKLDANHDESLTSGEFAKLLPGKLTKNNALVKTQEAMFAWFDENASGGIDLAEWLDAKTNTGSEGPDFSDEVVDELDTNGNGTLTWKEFSRVMNSYVPSKTARGWFDESWGGSFTGSLTSVVSSFSGLSRTVSGGTLTSGGSFSESISGGSVTVVGYSTGAWNTYTGSTTVSGGSLSVSGSLEAGTTLTGTGNLTLNSSGGSTTVPSGVNGSSTVNVGTGSGLTLGNGSSIADTATLIFVDAGAITWSSSSSGTVLDFTQTDASQTLGGGTFSSDVVINSTLNPGNSPDSQTYTAGLTLAEGSTITMEIAGSGGVAGTDFDSINVTGGTLTNDGSLTLVDFGGFDISTQTGSYNLFDMVASTGDFDVVTVDGNSLNYTSGTDTWSSTVGGITYEFNEGTGVLSVSE